MQVSTVIILLVELAACILLLRAAAMVREGMRYIAFVLMPLSEECEGDMAPNWGTPIDHKVQQ